MQSAGWPYLARRGRDAICGKVCPNQAKMRQRPGIRVSASLSCRSESAEDSNRSVFVAGPVRILVHAAPSLVITGFVLVIMGVGSLMHGQIEPVAGVAVRPDIWIYTGAFSSVTDVTGSGVSSSAASALAGSRDHSITKDSSPAQKRRFMFSFLPFFLFRFSGDSPTGVFPATGIFGSHTSFLHLAPDVARGSYQFKCEPVFFIKLYCTFAYVCVLFCFSQKSPYICLPLCSFCLFAQIFKKRKKTVDRAEHQC